MWTENFLLRRDPSEDGKKYEILCHLSCGTRLSINFPSILFFLLASRYQSLILLRSSRKSCVWEKNSLRLMPDWVSARMGWRSTYREHFHTPLDVKTFLPPCHNFFSGFPQTFTRIFRAWLALPIGLRIVALDEISGDTPSALLNQVPTLFNPFKSVFIETAYVLDKKLRNWWNFSKVTLRTGERISREWRNATGDDNNEGWFENWLTAVEEEKVL